VGLSEGDLLGCSVGKCVGLSLGESVGCSVGSLDSSGYLVCKFVGYRVSAPVGSSLGEFYGSGAIKGGWLAVPRVHLLMAHSCAASRAFPMDCQLVLLPLAIPKIDWTVALFQHWLDLPKEN
jgi:hypothetical protein